MRVVFRSSAHLLVPLSAVLSTIVTVSPLNKCFSFHSKYLSTVVTINKHLATVSTPCLHLKLKKSKYLATVSTLY